MKKIVCVLLALVLGCSLALLSACTGRPEELEDQTADEIDFSQFDENTEATLKISIQSYDNEEALIRSVAEVFNQKYPKVNIQIDRMSGELTSTLMSYYNAEASAPGTMPDIWFTTSFNMLALSQNDIILNLDPYLEAATNQELFNEDDYVAEYWTLGKNNFEDEQLMIPRSADRVVVHTNVANIQAAQDWCDSQGVTDADFWRVPSVSRSGSRTIILRIPAQRLTLWGGCKTAGRGKIFCMFSIGVANITIRWAKRLPRGAICWTGI